MSKKITMSDIAAALGISTVTVSKALSGQKGVSEEMRQKIIDLAEERGYQRTLSARASGNYKIGVLIAARYLGNIDSFYGHMYQIFSVKAGKQGSFTMLEVLSVEDEQNLVYPKLIGDGNVDAVVIMGPLDEEYIAMLDEKLMVPTFYMDFTDRQHKKDSVISGSYYGAYLLTNYLIDKGHRNIGFVGTVLATSSITDRYLGYARSLMEHGIKVNDSWVLDDRDENNQAIDLDKYIKWPRGKVPTAFVCNCDLTACRFIQYLKEKGLSVPDDVSIVGYDDFVYANSTDIGITTYKVDMDEMARRILKRIHHALRGEKYRSGFSIVEGYLIERESVKSI